MLFVWHHGYPCLCFPDEACRFVFLGDGPSDDLLDFSFVQGVFSAESRYSHSVLGRYAAGVVPDMHRGCHGGYLNCVVASYQETWGIDESPGIGPVGGENILSQNGSHYMGLTFRHNSFFA